MLRQALRFGIVGIIATLVHMLVGGGLILAGIPAPRANVIAFSVAFAVSFIGHFRYSFAGTSTKIGKALIKFSIAALCGFAVNQSLLLYFVNILGVPDLVSLILSTALAAGVVFVISKFWAFRGEEHSH